MTFEFFLAGFCLYFEIQRVFPKAHTQRQADKKSGRPLLGQVLRNSVLVWSLFYCCREITSLPFRVPFLLVPDRVPFYICSTMMSFNVVHWLVPVHFLMFHQSCQQNHFFQRKYLPLWSSVPCHYSKQLCDTLIYYLNGIWNRYYWQWVLLLSRRYVVTLYSWSFDATMFVFSSGCFVITVSYDLVWRY